MLVWHYMSVYQSNKKVQITNEMLEKASDEAKRRDPHIKHHFNVKHLTGEQRDIIGFIGELACCEFLGIDWKNNIRENYYTIDEFDINLGKSRIDTKTETIPYQYAKKILNKSIIDDELYGRRLINIGQVNLLKKYDIVIFGLLIRSNLKFWYPIGYQMTNYILSNYKATNLRPDKGRYPYPGLPVKTSSLLPIEELIKT